ncbi:MAG: iron-sulfur cluster assembly scaffold protein, partial [Clostridia bacterium]|nr:iron-sulfur cluster assembly scaffold protein [Clostridia bacterium]
KVHCSVLAEEAIKAAIDNYKSRQGVNLGASHCSDCSECCHKCGDTESDK